MMPAAKVHQYDPQCQTVVQPTTGASWLYGWRAIAQALSPSRRHLVHPKGLIPSAKAAQDCTRCCGTAHAAGSVAESAPAPTRDGPAGGDFRDAGASCRRANGSRARGSWVRAASGAPFDDVPMRGGRRPQADAERTDEGGPTVAAPAPAEDELVQGTLDVLPAQPVIHDHCPEPRTSWSGRWLPRSFPASGQRLCSGQRKRARNPMRSSINGTAGMRPRIGQRIADNGLASGARNK